MLEDADPSVRAAAIGALGVISHEDAATLARPLLADPDPRIRATAAVALAASRAPEDVDAAETRARALIARYARQRPRRARRDVAQAIRQIAQSALPAAC